MSLISLVVLLPVLLLLVYLMVTVFGNLRMPRFGTVKLNCPHCDAETPAHLGTCKSCGREL